jgi:hypothetical protein
MRYLLGAVEVLLAVAFIGSGIRMIVVNGPAIVPMAEMLLLAAVGLWLGKKAVANFRPVPAKGGVS